MNLGCPQACALKDHFGAFLAEKMPDKAIACIKAMRQNIDATHRAKQQMEGGNQEKPSRPRLSCKIRLFDSDDQTLAFAKQLVEAGCELLAHCRRRGAKSEGPPDLAAGRKLVEALPNIPVIINGAVLSVQDVQAILAQTGAAGDMIATGFLFNPCLMEESEVDPAILAAKYLDSCEKYPPVTPLFIRRTPLYSKAFAMDISCAFGTPGQVPREFQGLEAATMEVPGSAVSRKFNSVSPSSCLVRQTKWIGDAAFPS